MSDRAAIGTPAGGVRLPILSTARHITVFAKDTQQCELPTGVPMPNSTLEDSIVDIRMKLSNGVNLADGSPGAGHDSRLGHHGRPCPLVEQLQQV